LDAVKRAEAKFIQEKKERQIELLKEEEAGRRQTLYFSAGVTVAMVVFLLMLYRSTLFRRKFYNEKEKLLTQQAATIKLQKEEAEQTLQLQKKASERLALEHQLEVSQRDQYQRELVTGVHYLESKNDLLLKLKDAVTGMPPGQGEEHTEVVVAQMLKLIDDNLDADNDFDRFSRNFEYVYPNFFKRLEERSGDNLSQLDLRYCAYIYMGLSTKEMSNLLNVDPASIRTARYRLKQKFDLGKEEDLMAFINNNFSA
jgi:DNA-binding CsgD family transcriptional regulator